MYPQFKRPPHSLLNPKKCQQKLWELVFVLFRVLTRFFRGVGVHGTFGQVPVGSNPIVEKHGRFCVTVNEFLMQSGLFELGIDGLLVLACWRLWFQSIFLFISLRACLRLMGRSPFKIKFQEVMKGKGCILSRQKREVIYSFLDLDHLNF